MWNERPLEVLHAGDGRQLEQVEDPDGQHVPAAADLVAAVGGDEPASLVLQPLGTGHARVEQRVVLEAVARRDLLEVVEDLLAPGVAPGGDVVELLEHRDVHVRLDVAHDPRVSVPVPGAADAARLIDDADPLDAGLAEVGARQHPGDAAADDQDVDFVVDRVAVGPWCERVVAVPREVGVVLQVTDLGPAFDQPAVAFGQVLGADGLLVETRSV